MRKSGFGAIVLRDVASQAKRGTGANVPGYSGVLSEHIYSLGPVSQSDALGWYALPFQGK